MKIYHFCNSNYFESATGCAISRNLELFTFNFVSVAYEDRDVVLEDLAVDNETAYKLDSAISEAFRAGNFDTLLEMFLADSILVDYKVILCVYYEYNGLSYFLV
jgi:hypothetical protein